MSERLEGIVALIEIGTVAAQVCASMPERDIAFDDLHIGTFELVVVQLVGVIEIHFLVSLFALRPYLCLGNDKEA